MRAARMLEPEDAPAPGGRPLRAVALVTLALAWTAIVYAAFRPGLMSIDGIVEYKQGLELRLDNQHPPLVALIFGLSGHLLGTPAGVLALQLSTISGGLALLAWRGARDGRRSVLAFGVVAAALAAPPTWALGAVLGKDALLGGVLLLACWALRTRRTAAALALAVVGTVVRYNAIFATVPLAVGAVWQARRLARAGWPARAGAAAAAIALLAGSPAAVERLTRAQDLWPAGQLLAYDLAGIYARHPEALAASPIGRDLTAADLARLYTPLTGGPLIFPAHPGDPGLPFHRLAEHKRELVQGWLHAVRAYPGAYLAHRWAVFLAILGAYRGPVFYPYHPGLDPNPWGFALSPETPPYRALTAIRDASRETPLFRGWLWVGLCALAAALAAARARRDPVPLWIAASGLAYALAYLLVSVSAELRYLYWTELAPFATAAAALAAPGVARRAPGPRERGAAPS